jgi:hypothetical protein
MSPTEVSNATYQIKNIGKDNKCLTLTGAVVGTPLIVKETQADDKQKVH